MLYQLLYVPCKSFEQEMTSFRLTSEEAFLECFIILDYIKSHYQKESLHYIGSIYDTLICDYRDLAAEHTKEDDLIRSASVVVYGLVMVLSLSTKPFYSKLVTSILSQLTAHKVNTSILKDRFMSTYFRMDAQELRDSFEQYMNSNQFLSDELQEAIEQNTLDLETKDGSRFSQKQAIIFTIESLNIALTEINVSAMARLIEDLTGYKGVRPIINNMKNGKAVFTPTDSLAVAAALDDVKPDLAKKIRQGATE